MLALRCLRYMSTRCQPVPLYTWTLKTRTPVALQLTTNWYVQKPTMTAGYSSNPKDAFTSLLIIQKRMDSTVAPEPKPISTSSTTVGEIKTASTTPPTETKTTINPNLTTHIESPVALTTSSSSSSLSSLTPEIQSLSDKSVKNKTSVKQAKSPTSAPPKPPMPDSRIQPPNIKLPSRDQVEKYFFTALVYAWDFCYYVFCLSLRLLDTYVLKNPTIQENWKKLMKRLDEQRQSIKSKK